MAPTATSTRQEALAFTTVNRVRIAYADTGGTGIPLVLVHGSWGSHPNWDSVVPGLAERFRVVSYDRRGHSDSERPSGQGHFSEDVADLAALIEQLGIAPAWVAGSSSGAVIALQLAAARPHVVRGIVVHEPPLFGVLEEGSAEARVVADLAAGPLSEVGRLIGAGDHAGAAEHFVDQVALGPGSWAALLTSGDRSPSVFAPVERRLVRLLRHAQRTTYAGAGHIPHVTHPDDYVAELVEFIDAKEADRR